MMVIMFGRLIAMNAFKGRDLNEFSLFDSDSYSRAGLDLLRLTVITLSLRLFTLIRCFVFQRSAFCDIAPLFRLNVFPALRASVCATAITQRIGACAYFAPRLITRFAIFSHIEVIERLRNSSKRTVGIGAYLHEVIPCQPCLMDGVDNLTRLGFRAGNYAALVHIAYYNTKG